MMRARDTRAQYPIRAVSKLTGIGIDTLRAWERRHAAVAPVRDSRGRMYTEDDIVRLRLLRDAVENGHSIARVARLSDKDLRTLTAAARGVATAPPHAVHPAVLDAATLTTALAQFDAAGIDREIARLTAVLRPFDLVRNVLMPTLAQVGDDWHQRRAGIAHEHLMSSTIRNVLGSFLRLQGRADAPARLLFATPSGDRHEIGTLGAAILAASSGLSVTYLGPDLPAIDIVNCVKPAGAQVVVLGLTTTLSRKAMKQEMQTLVRALPRDVELWIGGPGAVRHADIIGARGLVLPDYDSYQTELVRIGGRES
ncbi:MAG: MerR family transcriptional regulator [Vicinamibacterales bacterium]